MGVPAQAQLELDVQDGFLQKPFEQVRPLWQLESLPQVPLQEFGAPGVNVGVAVGVSVGVAVGVAVAQTQSAFAEQAAFLQFPAVAPEGILHVKPVEH